MKWMKFKYFVVVGTLFYVFVMTEVVIYMHSKQLNVIQTELIILKTKQDKLIKKLSHMEITLALYTAKYH